MRPAQAEDPWPTLELRASGYLTDFYLGSGVTATTPKDVTLHASGATSGDAAGANLILAGGLPYMP